MPNFRMTLSYDGTRYNGWQRQGNTPDTIQGRLEAVLSDLLDQPVEVAGSGRTDAGVHARMQTASFRARTDLHAPAPLCGTHDYTSFCANRRMKKSAVRTVDAITVERRGEEVRLTFSGDGFLYHMVRILTGTLLEVGLGQRDADTMPAILAARDRSAAGPTAPARGLILWETRY